MAGNKSGTLPHLDLICHPIDLTNKNKKIHEVIGSHCFFYKSGDRDGVGGWVDSGMGVWEGGSSQNP